MLTKSTLKLVKSLHQKKNRHKHGLFLVEGEKNVEELAKSNLTPFLLLYTDAFARQHPSLMAQWQAEAIRVKSSDLPRAGTLKTNQMALALARIPDHGAFEQPARGIILVADGINDPGNLGTLIRSADWFGLKHVLLSPDTVDPWNPKTVMAAKGSLFHTGIWQLPLAEMLRNSRIPVIGALLEGKPLYELQAADAMYVVLGSESHGIRQELLPCITHPINIPGSGHAESLNVGVAAGILMYSLTHLKK